MITIPFNKPNLVGNEFSYIQDAISRWHISGDGYYTQKCSELIENIIGVKKVLLTTSCTHALEMSALLLNIQEGDEVIIPSFTFVSTVNAFVLRGAKPIFIDIRQDTLNMDEKLLEESITERTKAIIPVHYAGVGCEMDKIVPIAKKYGLSIVEDNAHGLFGKYKGRYLGTFGSLGTQSFHETKNITCGEGGALLINDETLIERAEVIREKGTNRKQFFLGQVDKYTWIDLGSSYLLSDILAAYLWAQLEARSKIHTKRKYIWDYYNNHLKSWSRINDVCLPYTPNFIDQPYHMFYLLLPSFESRNALISYLRSRGIQSVFHYLPLHLSHMGKTFGYQNSQLPVTEDISNRLLRLPFYYSLKDLDLEFITQSIQDFDIR